MNTREQLEQGAIVERMVALVGLPRSGTTLLASVFAVHPAFHVVFEPWNAGLLIGPEEATLQCLTVRSKMPPNKRCVLVKETSAKTTFVENLRGLMASAGGVERHALFVVRNPAHIYLSEIQRRREWWGVRDLNVSVETFERWCRKTRPALTNILEFLAVQNGAVISYEAFAESPRQMLSQLCARFGVEVEARQLEYHRYLDTSAVRGDRNIELSPQPISSASIRRREIEEIDLRDIIRASTQADWFAKLTGFVRSIGARGIVQMTGLDRSVLEGIADPGSRAPAAINSTLSSRNA